MTRPLALVLPCLLLALAGGVAVAGPGEVGPDLGTALRVLWDVAGPGIVTLAGLGTSALLFRRHLSGILWWAIGPDVTEALREIRAEQKAQRDILGRVCRLVEGEQGVSPGLQARVDDLEEELREHDGRIVPLLDRVENALGGRRAGR